MQYSKGEVLQYVQEEDVKFIRLAFCDVFGRQKNISIMPEELPRAFSQGIAFDASAIKGFGDEAHSDLLLIPEPETLVPLPWRPEHGRVMRMFCRIVYPDGTPFECDTRTLLKRAVSDAEAAGYTFRFGSEQEFYLFKLDEEGEPTQRPYDHAGYMDIAPEDRGENIRREICLTLEQMGIQTESSHHEEGPGQNEIDFRYSDPLTAADQTLTFQTIVRTVAHRNGLHADFTPKPLADLPGNGFHINMSVNRDEESALLNLVAGILIHIKELTVFLNPAEGSYRRLGQMKAPGYLSWSHENRSQLVRIPAAIGEYRRAELRSPDPLANPYLAFSLLIYAALDGLEQKLTPPPESNLNLFRADEKALAQFEHLPMNLADARSIAASSAFVRAHLPADILEIYCR
jgi:glutamine synthetase